MWESSESTEFQAVGSIAINARLRVSPNISAIHLRREYKQECIVAICWAMSIGISQVICILNHIITSDNFRYSGTVYIVCRMRRFKLASLCFFHADFDNYQDEPLTSPQTFCFV